MILTMSERKVSESVLFSRKYRPSLLSVYGCVFTNRRVFGWFVFRKLLFVYVCRFMKFLSNCPCLIDYKSWLIWMLFLLYFKVLVQYGEGRKVPRGGNLTFSRWLGVGNLTLASMKMSNSPGSNRTWQKQRCQLYKLHVDNSGNYTDLRPRTALLWWNVLLKTQDYCLAKYSRSPYRTIQI